MNVILGAVQHTSQCATIVVPTGFPAAGLETAKAVATEQMVKRLAYDL